ncbi:TIR domain-containing protein [Bacillus cereus]|uniref:TIR domain-containing protein n=1 Tax=Bacillus cereus TaxID=1396 RepID=UPI001C92F07F|nr:TIR domain-containing protein [Bacillus cereus]
MDALKKLSFEVEGILGTLRRYTSDPHVIAITKSLCSAVQEENIEDVLYLLGEIKSWYDRNQAKIQSSQFARNKDAHIEIERKIIDYINELEKSQTVNELKKTVEQVGSKMTKKIFISHSSKDEKVCSAFVELLENLGVPEDMILYSTSPRHGVPGDVDIFDYLRDNIAEGITVYYMLSDNYYQSVYCLNEMGAAWIAQNDASIFILPNLTKKIEGVIDSKKKAYTLNQPVELLQLKNKILETFGGQISEAKWEDVKNKFLETVRV